MPCCLGCGLTPIQNNNFHFLLDWLEVMYGSDHPVIHYIAAVFSLDEPIMEKYTIAGLCDPKTQNMVNTVSTFYLPPKTLPKCDWESTVKMGILGPGQDIIQPSYPSSRWLEPEVSACEAYGAQENAAIAKIESHVPSFYRPLSASTAIKEVMIKLALDPRALTDYKCDPALFSDSHHGRGWLYKMLTQVKSFPQWKVKPSHLLPVAMTSHSIILQTTPKVYLFCQFFSLL